MKFLRITSMTAALILFFYLLQFFLIIFILLFYIFSRRKFLLYSMENSIAEINFTNQLSWNNFHRTTYNLAISLFHRSIQWKQFLYCTTFSHSNCSSPVNFTGQKVRKFKNLEYVRVLVRISFRQTKHTLRKTFFLYLLPFFLCGAAAAIGAMAIATAIHATPLSFTTVQ